MADKDTQLLWEDLRRMEGDLPWPTLETFADAVVADPDLAKELFAEYERAWQAADVPTYIDLYVPAIFTLVAPKLGEQQRREAGDFLVDKLMEAGREDADLTEDALLVASGSMGPAILPKVLDTLETMADDDDSAAGSRCWNLTALAVKTHDEAIRNRTIRACVRRLEQIERGKAEEFFGISAAWTLALLKHSEAAPQIQRLGEECDDFSGGADYREALEFLQGRRVHAYEEAWEWPVKEWLESSWRTARDWYARHNSEGSGQVKKTFPLEQEVYDSSTPTPFTPPIPIVEHSLRVGRNDPCPCGSGKKYKKCCGDPIKGQAATPLH